MWRVILPACVLAAVVHGVAVTDKRTVDMILRLHNEARKAVGLGPLTWDPNLADLATKINRKNCVQGNIKHTKPKPKKGEVGYHIGESLSYDYPKGDRPYEVAKMGTEGWINERDYYNVGTNVCNGPFDMGWFECGHYTQVVWDDTAEIGCATEVDGCVDPASQDENGNPNPNYKPFPSFVPAFFACRYRSKPGGLPGNWMGSGTTPMRPYGRGGGAPKPKPPPKKKGGSASGGRLQLSEIRVVSSTTDGITIAWDPAGSKTTGYKVYYEEAEGMKFVTDDLPAGTTTYTVTRTGPWDVYNVKVTPQPDGVPSTITVTMGGKVTKKATKPTTPATTAKPLTSRRPKSTHGGGRGKPKPLPPLPTKDKHPSCCGWAAYEECGKNPVWMILNCPVACAVIGPGAGSDKSASIAYAEGNCGVYRELYLAGVPLGPVADAYAERLQ